MIAQVETAWREAGLAVSFEKGDTGRVIALTAPSQFERAFSTAVRTLKFAGARTCWERHRGRYIIFAFAERGSVAIDLRDGSSSRNSVLKSIIGSRMRSIALLGPDGVGKSTALRLVREWFEREAPFVNITIRQWRPDLLPSLASIAGKPEDPSGKTRPRRTPGKFHWLRLTYYYLDFLLGSWWKDRTRGRETARMVVYDRCALDMFVDPVRFALQSRRGTWALWKSTPQPEMRVLLYDDADNIAQRKDDLGRHDIAEQLETWLKLAAQDEVHAIIRVNDGPEEIARRIRDLFIEAFVQHHEHDLAPSAQRVLGTNDERPTHAVVPNAGNPRFLIPLSSRNTSAASLAIYNAQRPSARIAKSLLKIGLRSGIAQPLLRHRTSLGMKALHDHLSHVLGHSNISIAVSLGTPGPNQKPALQIMNRQGRILAYAKLGWNDQTINSIRNEEAGLKRLESARFSTAIVPRVLDAGWIENNYLLVQSPATNLRQTGPVPVDDRHIRFLAELYNSNRSSGPLPCPAESTIARLRRTGLHYQAHLLECFQFQYESLGPVPYAPGHGDFTPWNIRISDGKLVVFDWETFENHAPAGWDLFHLLVAGEVEIRGTKPGVLYRGIMEPGSTRNYIENYFLAIGTDNSLIEPLFMSYAASALASSLLNLGPDAGEKDRAMQKAWAAVLAINPKASRRMEVTATA